MSILFRRIKILLAAPVVLLLWWIVLRRPPKTAHTTCNQLFSGVHNHIDLKAFDDREEAFTVMWVSRSALEKEACSYYSFRRNRNSIMIGFEQLSSGEKSNRYLGYTKGEDGVVSYYLENDPSNILGYFYPLFFDDYGPGIGFVECTDSNGYAEWKASLAVPLIMAQNPASKEMVRKGIDTFQRLAPQLGVDIHQGDYYKRNCWQPPVWGRVKFVRPMNDSA